MTREKFRAFVKRRRVPIIAGAVIVAFLATGASACQGGGNSSGNVAESAQQSTDTTTLVTAIPLPDFPTSQIRLDLIQVEADQALGVKSTSFGFQQGDPDPIWSCPSEGLPMPVTDQLSNPTQPDNVNSNNNGDWNTIPVGQMDPNGIYQGDGSGTDVLCLNSSGQPYVHYWEGNVDSVTANAYWDSTKRQVTTVGAPIVPTCVVAHKNQTDSSGNPASVAYESCSVPKSDAVSK